LRLNLIIAGLWIVLAGCTGLAGEPRIVATIPPPTLAPTEVGHPIAPPDMAIGAALFAANCTACHGLNGAGDGELVQSGQVQNAGNFTLPETVISQRPTAWHDTITNGRIENLMPPWRDALTEQERWDVGMYTYTLHYTHEQLERGRALFGEKCSECHGDSGAGDGRRADEFGIGGVKDLTYQRGMVMLSDDAIYNIINEGIGNEDGMPAFGAELSESDMRAVASYARTLSLTNANIIAAPPLQATEEPVASLDDDAPILGTITGALQNGTVGGVTPANTDVTLFVFLPDADPLQLTVTANENGSFRFDGVTLQADGQYVSTVLYRDRVFTSTLTAPPVGAAALDLPITVYELTEDPSVIEIAGVVTQVSAIGSSLEIVQVFSFRNTSDRAFSTSQIAENGRPISVVISLPPGAVITGFSDSEARYVVLPEQFLLVDTAPVMPGEEHIVQVIYIVQYAQDAIIEQPMQYALNGPARLLIRPTNLRVASAQLAPLGIETLGTTEFAAYGAELALEVGGVLRYDVSGSTLDVSQRAENLVSSSNLPTIIAAVIIGEIALIGGLYFWYRQRASSRKRQQPDTRAMQDALVRQIAALDAAHDKGEIADDYHQRQRAALKTQLTELMKNAS